MRAGAAPALLTALLLASPAGAQSFLGQSRPGGAPGGAQGGAAPVPSTAPLQPVQVAPLPSVTTPATPPQPIPPPQPGPQLQPGQFLPAVPPPPGSTPPPALPGPPAIAPVAPVQSEWVPQGMAELRGVDKVTARISALTARVGETVRFGPLSVTVRGCLARPPDRAPDAAAFLEISEGARRLFGGWMILSQPQLALLEHPTHDIRLFACRP